MPTEIQVQQVKSYKFTSNAYLINDLSCNSACLIDVVDYEAVESCLKEKQEIRWLFLTHYHYDHIWGINELVATHPNCTIVTNSHGVEGLRSSKINLSFYHENPVEYRGENILVVDDKETIISCNNLKVKIIQTPGHNPSCLTYQVNDFIFSGDSYIPGIKVVTKLKGGDIELSQSSLGKIRNLINKDSSICPGHREVKRGYEVFDDPILFGKLK